MTQLFNVSFTTKQSVKKYDDKRRVIGEVQMSSPITMTALTHAKAMSFASNPDFKMEPHDPSVHRRGSSAGSASWGGAATKKVQHIRASSETATTARPVRQVNHTAEAARTGDLSSAINAGGSI